MIRHLEGVVGKPVIAREFLGGTAGSDFVMTRRDFDPGGIDSLNALIER